MTALTNMSGRWPQRSSMTPPVLCSSRASESSGSGRRVTLTPADSMEYIRKMIKEDRSSSLLDKSRYQYRLIIIIIHRHRQRLNLTSLFLFFTAWTCVPK